MKFSATKEKILEGLQQVQNVVSTRTTLPILSNVLLQAKEGTVNLTTTDLDVGVRGGFEANVDKAGATTPWSISNWSFRAATKPTLSFRQKRLRNCNASLAMMGT